MIKRFRHLNLLLSIILLFWISNSAVLAVSSSATPTVKISPTKATTLEPTPEPKPTSIDKNVQLLKEKIATKVAELRRENKSVIAGRISKIDKDSISVKTNEDKTYKVAIDDTITKIYRLDKKKVEIKTGDLAVGDYIVVAGIQIEDLFNASLVYVDKEFVVLSGKITDIDNKEFILQVITTDKDNYTLEVESTTKQSIYNIDSDTIVKSGFSKIKVGDTIHFVIEKVTDKKNSAVSAIRLLIIPQEYFTAKK